MEGVELKPSLSLGLVQMMQQSLQQQQMSAGGQLISLQPPLSSGSGLSDDPIQAAWRTKACCDHRLRRICRYPGILRFALATALNEVETAMQIASRDATQLFLHSSNGISIGHSPVGNTPNLNRKGSPLLSGQFRTPSYSVDQGMSGRHPSPSGGHPPHQVTSYQQIPRASSQSGGHPASHGAFRALVSSELHQNGLPRPLPSHPSSTGTPRMGLVPHNSPIQAQDGGGRKRAVRNWGNRPLSEMDPDLWEIMEDEKRRQWRGIELIASENFTSLAVLEALGSHLTNKYSEGLPGSRYYKGNEHIDQMESLCIARALAVFHLDPEKWGVNVQPYSCSSANFAVYTALLQPNDRIMGLDVLSGGHVSHGYHTQSGRKIPAASIFFQTLPFKLHPETGLIDYEKMEEIALRYRPKILICGGSSYPREWNYARFRQVADKINAVLMCDMAHISGLVAAQECLSPFDYCDVVTTTTHKSLRGPRGGMVFFRRGWKSPGKPADGQYSFEKEINIAVHPTIQGGPHNNHIAALAAAMKQASSAEYKQYIQQVKKNAQSLAEGLKRRGCKLVTDGTDNHLMLWDLRPSGVSSGLFEEVCEACHITVNKNAVYGDSSSFQPGGVRLGTPAMTSRGCDEGDFDLIADFLHRAMQITAALQKENPKQSRRIVRSNSDMQALKANVEKFATSFEMPGFEVSTLKQPRA